MENRSSLVGIIAIIIGVSGLGIGAYSMVNFQTVEGPQGLPGNDGQDLVGLQVGILDPDQLEVISGLVEIRVLLWNSSECSINVFINGSLNATSVPWVWNTTTVSDGRWNVSVRAMDTESNSVQDEVMVYVLNNPGPTPRARVYLSTDMDLIEYFSGGGQNKNTVDFDRKSYDSTNSFNLSTDRYIVPEDGYYLLILKAPVTVYADANIAVDVIVGGLNAIYTAFSARNPILQFTFEVSDILYLSYGTSIRVDVSVFNSDGVLLGGPLYTVFSITKLNN